MNEHAKIFIDPGTSSWKCSVEYAGKLQYFEFCPFFYLAENNETLLGLESETLEKPEKYRGLIGRAAALKVQYGITRNATIYSTPEFHQGIYFAVGKGLDVCKAPKEYDITTFLSLPHGHITAKEELENDFRGLREVKIGSSIHRSITIDKLHAVRQGVLCMIDQLVQRKKQGFVSRASRLMEYGGNITAMVIGSNTIELCYFDGDFSRSTHDTIERGVSEILPHLKPKVYHKTDIQPSQYQLIHNVLEQGSFCGVDFRHDVNKLIHGFMADCSIHMGVEMFLNSTPKPKGKNGLLIVAGGPALAGIDSIEKAFADKFERIMVAKDDKNADEPRIAVSRGLTKTPYIQ